MNELRTIIGSRVLTSLRINGVYVPANSLTSVLQSYTAPALFHSDGFGKYHLSKSGSLFKVKTQGRYFCLVSAHQVLAPSAGYDHEQLCLHNPTSGKVVTSHRVIFPNDDPGFGYDVLLYEFTECVEAKKLYATDWFKIGRKQFSEAVPKPSKAVSIGYPSFRNTFDYEESKYAIGPNAVWGEEVEPKVNGRLAFAPMPEISFDPSGMSGAPVFGIYLNELEPALFFAGLLTNASPKVFNFISRTRLAHVIEDALAS
ncbi:hypothetical protein [Roseovarius indicus]|uniref:hypothetical protein n=1 Tax=Roseovarius indicus TaxID=540747 RepID=UPI0032ED73B5